MPDPLETPAPATAVPLDGDHDTIRSGVWLARPFLSALAFPEALLLTAADARLASKLAKPAVLFRRRVGPHVVELLLERGEDRSVDLALRIPTAESQFKDPYILMEAEDGNTREVAVREFQFHLQGRIPEADVAAADWAGFFASAARRLAAMRPQRKKAGATRRNASRRVKTRKKAPARRKARASR